MATIKVKLRESTVAGKAGTVYYQLTHGRQVRQITTCIHVLPEKWDKVNQCPLSLKTDPGWCLIQDKIESDTALLRRIIRELENTRENYTIEDILRRFRSPQFRISFSAFMREQINLMLETRRLGTARNYTSALDSFSAFLAGREVSLAVLTEPLVEEYNAFLLQRGVVRNTISFYMRILRSVYNKAVCLRLVKQSFPFRNVYTGIDHTRKRAVGEQVISRLCRLNLRYSPPLELARDLFLFSYCMRGMAFVDMAYLRKESIRNGAIRYVRHKTGQWLEVKLEPYMQRIIDRYAETVRDGPYLFPILKTEDPEAAYTQYQVGLNYYNRLLKKLSGLLGLEWGLSSYTSRHSWATAARDHNVPLPVISAGMGHTSEHTTQIYLKTLENSVIDSANRGIIAALEDTVSM